MEIKNLYTIHRIIMVIATCILLPIGLFMSLGKKYVGENWYTYHKNIMLSVVGLMFIGIMVSLYTREKDKEKRQLGVRHGTLGIIIFILLLVQIWWAIVIRKQVSTKSEQRLLSKKTWLNMHRVFATLIVSLIFYQLYLGLNIYKTLN